MASILINDGVVIDYSEDGWDEYKKWLDGTYAYLSYSWADEGAAYALVAIDGKVYRTFSINKADATEFEASYRVSEATEALNPDRSQIVSDRNLVLGQVAFLRSDDGTQVMNINGDAAGATTVVWNGTGGGDTGGDWTRAGVGSESTASAKSGTNGLDTGVAALDDVSTFADATDSNIGGSFSQVSFWMQPKAFPRGATPTIRWQKVDGTESSKELRLESYVRNFDLDVWQKVTIPMSDFQLTGNVGKLVFTYRTSAGQRFWFDDVELTARGGGGPYIFDIEAPVNTRYHVSMLVLLMSGPSSGWNASTFANIGALTNGLLLRQRRVSTGEVLWSFNSHDNADMFGRYHPQDDIEFADGTLLVGFMVKPGKASIVVTDDDKLEFVVRDDLSGISTARAFAHFGVEDVS